MNFFNQFEVYDIPLLTNGVKLPKFVIPQEEFAKYNISEDISDYDFLVVLCKEGLDKKIGRNHSKYKEYQDRLATELKTFKDLEFCGYVLITWDIIRFCRKNSIGTGYARGSAAGSLILFLIDVVSHVDPVYNNLYFERFLSKSRAKFKEINGVKYYDGSLLLDVDLDIDFRKRSQVITYIEDTYPQKTAKLLTASTLSSKILLKEIVKVYSGESEEYANQISEMIPKIFGTVYNIDKSIAESKEFEEFAKNNEIAINIARKLHGLYLHYGVHPSAVVISAVPINDIIPLKLTKDKEIVTGYSMDDTLNLACKVDILGLRAVSLVDSVCDLIGISPNDIDVNDKIIYDNLKNLETPHGLFQIEAETNYNVLRKIKPRNLDDLSAIVSIARPGALQFVDDYTTYVETGKYQSVHPFFDDVFKDSGGLCLYQESLMRAANKVGFTLDESEILRRIVGKKKIEEVKEWKVKIENKIKENNLPIEIGDILWKILEDSASYSFNKSHATSYATMCAATTYLKFKYPKEFFMTLLRLSQYEPNPIEEVSKIYKELPYFGIKLLPPHIIHSTHTYEIEGDNIRMGLNSIKAISDKALEKLNKFRNKYSSKFDIFRAANSAGINLAVISNLIWAGSLDDMLSSTRAKTQMEYVLWNLLTTREKTWVTNLEIEYKYDLIEIVKGLNEKVKDEKGKPIIKDSRRLTLRKHFAPYLELYNLNRKNPDIFAYIAERELLGFSYSSTLFDIYKDKVDNLMPISYIVGEPDGSKVKFVCEVVESRLGESRAKKTPYLRLSVKDSSGSLKIMIFNTKYKDNQGKLDQMKELNGDRLPKENDICIIHGTKKEGDTVFADGIAIQMVDVFLKISQLPKDKINEY